MKNTFVYIWILLCLFVQYSCISDEIETDSGKGDAYVNLVFTRSGILPTPSENNETGVNSLRVFIYDASGRLEFTHKYTVPEGGHLENPVIKVKPGAKDIYAIVNEDANGVDTDGLNEKLASVSTIGDVNSSLLEQLIVKYTAFPESSSKGLLMTGMSLGQIIPEGISQTNPHKVVIEVVRNCARLDLKIQKSIKTASARVSVQKIMFQNGANLQTLFELPNAKQNPSGTSYGLRYTALQGSEEVEISKSQAFDGGNNFQDIGKYYLLENIVDQESGNSDNAEFMIIEYTVNDKKKTNVLYLNDIENAPGRYSIIRNTVYTLSLTVDSELKVNLEILDWNDKDTDGDIYGHYFNTDKMVVELNKDDGGNLHFDTDMSSISADWSNFSLDEYNIIIGEPTVETSVGEIDFTWGSGGQPAFDFEIPMKLQSGNIVKNITIKYKAPIPTNCYIVKNGAEQEIPLWGVFTPWKNIERFTKDTGILPSLGVSSMEDYGRLVLDVIWTDNAALNITGSIGPSINPNDPKMRSMTVKASGAAQANAIVGVRHQNQPAGNYLWSFHIWVSDYNPLSTAVVKAGYTFMDRNLGALSIETSSNGIYGMHYQWGRKDPFPFFLSDMETMIDVYPYTENSISRMSLQCLTTENEPSGHNGYASVADAIRKPNYFVTNVKWNHNWAAIDSYPEIYNLWKDTEKTAFDPCPKGWRVAPYNAWKNIRSGYSDKTIEIKRTGVCAEVTSEGSTLFIPNAGSRDDDYNKTQSRLGRNQDGKITVNSNLHYWSSHGLSDSDYQSTIFGLYFSPYVDFPTVNPYPDNRHRGMGYSVRCVKDNF